MSIRRYKSSNTTAIYLIAIAVILFAFFLLGGGAWVRGIVQENQSINFASWNWTTILISLGIGVLIGVLLMKRR